MGKAKIHQTSPINLERGLIEKGYSYVIGVDEAGRGALAGSLLMGYCVLPLERNDEWIMSAFQGVTDSKKLGEKRRQELFDSIEANALAAGAVGATSGYIDEFGITQTTQYLVRMAVSAAINHLESVVVKRSGMIYPMPHDVRIAILGDMGLYCSYNMKTFPYFMSQHIEGETKSLSIAAASIMAKVSRDKEMIELEPADNIQWGFAKHKGYGTNAHIEAIKSCGVHFSHRKTFQPIPKILAGEY